MGCYKVVYSCSFHLSVVKFTYEQEREENLRLFAYLDFFFGVDIFFLQVCRRHLIDDRRDAS